MPIYRCKYHFHLINEIIFIEKKNYKTIKSKKKMLNIKSKKKMFKHKIEKKNNYVHVRVNVKCDIDRPICMWSVYSPENKLAPPTVKSARPSALNCRTSGCAAAECEPARWDGTSSFRYAVFFRCSFSRPFPRRRARNLGIACVTHKHGAPAPRHRGWHPDSVIRANYRDFLDCMYRVQRGRPESPRFNQA